MICYEMLEMPEAEQCSRQRRFSQSELAKNHQKMTQFTIFQNLLYHADRDDS